MLILICLKIVRNYGISHSFFTSDLHIFISLIHTLSPLPDLYILYTFTSLILDTLISLIHIILCSFTSLHTFLCTLSILFHNKFQTFKDFSNKIFNGISHNIIHAGFTAVSSAFEIGLIQAFIK